MGAWGAGQTPPLKTTKQVQRLRAIVLQGRRLEEKFWWRASRNSVQGLSAAFRACKPAQPDPTQRGAPSRVPSHHLQLLLSPTVPPPSLILWAFAPPLPPFPSTNFSLCSLPPSSARDGPAKTDLLDLRPSSPNPPRGKARAKARWTDPAAAEWLRSRAGQTSAGELRSRDGELDLRRTPEKRQQDCTENKSSAPSPRAGAQRAGAPLELGGPRAPNKKLTSGSFTL